MQSAIFKYAICPDAVAAGIGARRVNTSDFFRKIKIRLERGERRQSI